MFDVTFMVYDENGNGVGIEVSNTADADGMVRLRTPDIKSSDWFGVSFDISIPLGMAKDMSLALARLVDLMEEKEFGCDTIKRPADLWRGKVEMQ